MHRGLRMLPRLLCAAAFLTIASSCSDSSTAAGTGRLTVLLTDAPFPFDSVARVDIYVVRIDARSDPAGDAAMSDAGDSRGWTTIARPERRINLLDLRNGVTTNLGAGALPVGAYNAFRLVLDTDSSGVTLTDGTTPPVKWPSAGQSGLKINLDAPIAVRGDDQEIVIDVDLARSFVMRGRSIGQNGLLFKPVIHAVARELTGAASGLVVRDSVGGAPVAGATVEILLPGTVLSDTAAANILRTTVTGVDGAWRVDFLLPGDYAARATAPDSTGLAPALLSGGLSVTSGTTSGGHVIVLSPAP
jgi:Domain of unknown function (DUF4382)